MNRIDKHFFPPFFAAIPLSVALLFAAAPGRAGSVRKTGDFYSVTVTTSKEGGKEIATVRVKGRAGYHCNTLYHWKLAVDPVPRVQLEKQLLENRDAQEFSAGGVIFRVRYFGGSGQKMSAKLKFSVCNDKQCVMEAVDLGW